MNDRIRINGVLYEAASTDLPDHHGYWRIAQGHEDYGQGAATIVCLRNDLEVHTENDDTVAVIRPNTDTVGNSFRGGLPTKHIDPDKMEFSVPLRNGTDSLFKLLDTIDEVVDELRDDFADEVEDFLDAVKNSDTLEVYAGIVMPHKYIDNSQVRREVKRRFRG